MAIEFREATLTCPSCDRLFNSRAVTGTSTVVSRGTDFHDRHKVGESVLPYLIHFCGFCGFCGEERLYTEEYDIGFKLALRDFVTEMCGPNLRWAQEYLADRYHHALQIAEFFGDNPLKLADLSLRAAWASVEEQDTESERFFRRSAAENYTLALQHYDMIEHKQRAQVTYLIGELWRRIGDEKLALLWFREVENAVLDRDEQQWVLALAERQRESPQDFM